MKPVILIGNGLRNNPQLIDSLKKLMVPILVTWQAADLINETDDCFCGRPGVVGQRAANIILQKCDWLMVIGARMDNEQVGHNLEAIAPNASKTVVDVDVAELGKFPNSWEKLELDLNGDNQFIFIEGNPIWLDECKNLYNRFRYEFDSTECDDVDPYSFIRELSDVCKPDDILVPGSSGQQSCAFMQAFKVKRGQRILLCNTIGAMGLEAMAIGAAIASDKRIIVVTGDGGFAQSFQELETVKRLKLPIHYFVFDNGGYGSISTMQDMRFNLRVGSTKESGLTLPDLEKVADLFDMPYFTIRTNDYLPMIGRIIEMEKATITRVTTSLAFRYAVKMDSTIKGGVFTPDNLADMTPKIEWKDLL